MDPNRLFLDEAPLLRRTMYNLAAVAHAVHIVVVRLGGRRMLFASFAHRLLLVFGVFTLVAVGSLAAKVGWLGEHAQAAVLLLLVPIQDFYEKHKNDLDFTVKVLGALGTALGAAWTVHKGWHYAERNLPDRLIELNSRWKDATERNRFETIPALCEIVSLVPPAVGPPGHLQKIFLQIYDPAQRALLACEERLRRCDEDFRILTNSRVRCRAEVVTNYLEKGAHLALAPDRQQDSLNAFKKALTFNRSDVDALELAAKQAFALNRRIEQ